MKYKIILPLTLLSVVIGVQYLALGKKNEKRVKRESLKTTIKKELHNPAKELESVPTIKEVKVESASASELEKSYQSKDDDIIKLKLSHIEAELKPFLVKSFSVEKVSQAKKAKFLELIRSQFILNKILLDRQLEEAM